MIDDESQHTRLFAVSRERLAPNGEMVGGFCAGSSKATNGAEIPFISGQPLESHRVVQAAGKRLPVSSQEISRHVAQLSEVTADIKEKRIRRRTRGNTCSQTADWKIRSVQKRLPGRPIPGGNRTPAGRREIARKNEQAAACCRDVLNHRIGKAQIREPTAQS